MKNVRADAQPILHSSFVTLHFSFASGHGAAVVAPSPRARALGTCRSRAARSAPTLPAMARSAPFGAPLLVALGLVLSTHALGAARAVESRAARPAVDRAMDVGAPVSRSLLPQPGAVARSVVRLARSGTAGVTIRNGRRATSTKNRWRFAKLCAAAAALRADSSLMKCSPSSASRLAVLEHIDPKWAWHHCALLKLRQKLLRRRPDPASSLEAAECAADHDHCTSHEAVLAELHRPGDRLPEVDAALSRIREHRYGRCEETGAPIPAARLRAMPWTRFAQPAAERSRR